MVDIPYFLPVSSFFFKPNVQFPIKFKFGYFEYFEENFLRSIRLFVMDKRSDSYKRFFNWFEQHTRIIRSSVTNNNNCIRTYTAALPVTFHTFSLPLPIAKSDRFASVLFYLAVTVQITF